MNRKRYTFKGNVLEGGQKEEAKTASYREMINRHFQLIERQCFKAVRRQLKNHGALNNPVNIENEAVELSNQVLDTLQRDDFRVLRQFKGDARLSTYLTTIIARQAVDMVRKKLGRSREKERAQKFGKTGMLIYEKMILQGCSIPEIYADLKSKEGIRESQEEIEIIAEKIKGKKSAPLLPVEDDSTVKEGEKVNENGDFVIADTHSDPQELLIEKQRKQNAGKIIKEIIGQLNGEERMLLRMRFPVAEEETPEKVDRISDILGISKKAVYKRITRILKKCRDILDQKGVTINDLL